MIHHGNLLDEKDIENIINKMGDQRCYPHKSGSLKICSLMPDKLLIINTMLDSIIPGPYQIRGYRYNKQYGDGWNIIHTEANGIRSTRLREQSDKDLSLSTPFRTYMIMLGNVGSTIIFNEKHYGKEDISKYTGCGEYMVYRTHRILDYNIPDEVYKKYLNHIPKDWLRGLTIDRVVECKKGDVISFDIKKLHVAGCLPHGVKEAIIIKTGLL